MISHLGFLKELGKFHENLRLGFYTKIFENKPADSVDWSKYKVAYYTAKRDIDWGYLVLPTLLITLVLGGLGAYKLRKL
ncbi:ABC-2 type transport system permease protein [Pseudozobellia thermophila]|uniref:ABC-2 type transport system permease protein n=1 Tax=Pseudozobellia thermophila TaxID=192903 RepID=A0A1M6EEX5_9FLAO|nr:ABC-2 type transport system permease protein [Pseudozobellia thermophila]